MKRSTLAALTIAAAPLLGIASPASAQAAGGAGIPIASSPPGMDGVVPIGPGDTVQNALGDGNTHRPPPHGTYDPWEPAYGYPPAKGAADTTAHHNHHHHASTGSTNSTNTNPRPNTAPQSPNQNSSSPPPQSPQ
jgi:hypothetical protein